MTAPLDLELISLTKRYGDALAVDAISHGFKSGVYACLLGPSGCGKSSTLRMIAGHEGVSDGAIVLDGREVTHLPPAKRGTAMMFQNYALFPHLSVRDNVAFSLRMAGIDRATRHKRANEMLELVEMSAMAERKPDQLSGGQQQRVALARALITRPQVLLLDEPLSALDKKLRDRMQIELRQLHEKLGMTTVYVTHDQREALTMSDRIAVVNFGRIMQLATPQQLYDQPDNKFVADFIGESTFLDVQREGDTCLAFGAPIKTTRPVPPGDNLSLMMRPERIHLIDGAPAPDDNVFEATVSDLVYQGESFLLYAHIANGPEVAVRGAIRGDTYASLPKPGASVRLGLHAADAVIIADEGR